MSLPEKNMILLQKTGIKEPQNMSTEELLDALSRYGSKCKGVTIENY